MNFHNEIIFRGIFFDKATKNVCHDLLKSESGIFREFLALCCTIKKNLLQNQETSFYEKQETFCGKTRKSFYRNRKVLLRKQESPSTVRTVFMCLYRSEYVPDSLIVVGVERANLGVLEAVFSLSLRGFISSKISSEC